MSIDQKPVTAPSSPSPAAGFPPVDHGRRLFRIETSRIATLIPVRAVVVSVVLVVVIIGAGLASMTLGAYEVDFAAVIRAIVDPASDPDIRQVVFEWRLPRVLFAVLCGAALALAGGIFQSLTRNPLGSPDIIGFGIGARGQELLFDCVDAAGGQWRKSGFDHPSAHHAGPQRCRQALQDGGVEIAIVATAGL